MNACACMGPMYGEPYCPCGMENRGLQKQMAENPLRLAEYRRSANNLRRCLNQAASFTI